MSTSREEFEKRRRRLLGLSEKVEDSVVGEKPSQRAAFEQRRKRILERKEIPIPKKEPEPEPKKKGGLGREN